MFIVIEGANGCGKTSAIKKLASKGVKTLSSPNGTDLAKYLRSACRGSDEWTDLSDMVKFLLFSAARCDEFDKLVKDQKELIVCDRWHLSTFVYQVILGGIPQKLYEMTIHPEEKIDRVIIMTAHPDVLADRVIREREKNPAHGICSWTKERDTMKRINEIYRNELPRYLETRGIIYDLIDTTNKSVEEVQSIIEVTLPIGRSKIE
jgi:thymidylate kinase